MRVAHLHNSKLPVVAGTGHAQRVLNAYYDCYTIPLKLWLCGTPAG